ncbi:LysE family translocator [Actinoplanes philippinensis]|uniref:LysE family translocator n=1 Tax=Actinoplanes philippinensis TaxID=35752 RepID=UPI0033ED9D3F
MPVRVEDADQMKAWERDDMDSNWVAFIGVVMVAYIIPGPDFAIILRSATKGARAGFAAAGGAQLGLCVHMGLAALGLAAVLTRNPGVLDAIRLAGGIYLLYLGGRLIVATLRRSRAEDTRSDQVSARSAFVQGLMTNLTNPKAILFFAAVLPQFVVVGDTAIPLQVTALGVLDVALGFVVWAAVIAIGTRLSTAMRRPRVRKWWDRSTGTVLGGLGLIALTRG